MHANTCMDVRKKSDREENKTCFGNQIPAILRKSPFEISIFYGGMYVKVGPDFGWNSIDARGGRTE